VHDEFRDRLCFKVPRPGDVIRVGVGVDDVGWAEAVLEDEIYHRLDHLELGIHDRREVGLGVGDDVAQTPPRYPDLLEEIAW
jgi:hypothetical protein